MNRSALPKSAPTLGAMALAALLMAGCGQAVSQSPATQKAGTAPASASAGSIENCGRTLTFDAAPDRVVAMTPGQSELLVKLGLAHKVVAEAQTKGRKLQPELKARGDVKQLSDQMPPSREVLLGANPDFVYSPTAYEFTAEQGFASIEQLKQAGAEAYIATAGCQERRSKAEVTDILTDIDKIGAVFGAGAKTTAVRDEAATALSAVNKAVAGKQKPTVVELFVEGNSIAAIGAGLEYDMIKTAGGDNLFSPSDEAFATFFSALISPETLVQKNPEVIVFTTLDKAHEEATRTFLKEKFPQVAAVKSDRLVAVNSDDVMPGTWGNIRAVEQIAKGLHPEAF
ncbi:ABC transporter substrate-binding protein [Paenarthrobacter nitroguajacolicus]|uniref:ABC transporter substrate-binding protein n=1 Tax=Paenarthrobacter nitroguajacolicus TaxID=211146 RepID=A0A558HAS7_PAENT|nr:ABC transporter substrate-binding protein [Paenarthrobacter nitroguajacolicus]TVU66235.1 ABC transporter substrate-binding protein [Paenarthrobacter nitroguajacolicus]